VLLPTECLNHEAVHLVSKSCYNKQKCAVAVGNHTFRDPCFPGTRKYLSVLYSCGRTLFCFLIRKKKKKNYTPSHKLKLGFQDKNRLAAASCVLLFGLVHYVTVPWMSICSFRLQVLICWSHPSAVLVLSHPKTQQRGIINCELRFLHPGKLPAIGTNACGVKLQHCSHVSSFGVERIPLTTNAASILSTIKCAKFVGQLLIQPWLRFHCGPVWMLKSSSLTNVWLQIQRYTVTVSNASQQYKSFSVFLC